MRVLWLKTKIHSNKLERMRRQNVDDLQDLLDERLRADRKSRGFTNSDLAIINAELGLMECIRTAESMHDLVSALHRYVTSKRAAVNDAAPPGLLIDMLVPASRAEDMLLQMEKAFEQRWLPKYGRRRARQIYLLQSTGAVIGYWINWIKQHLDVFKFFAS